VSDAPVMARCLHGLPACQLFCFLEAMYGLQWAPMYQMQVRGYAVPDMGYTGARGGESTLLSIDVDLVEHKMNDF